MNRYVWATLVFPVLYVIASFIMYDANPANWATEFRGVIAFIGVTVYFLIATALYWQD